MSPTRAPFAFLVSLVLVASACDSSSVDRPSSTTETPTRTETATAPPSATRTVTRTPTQTLVPTATQSATPQPTQTPVPPTSTTIATAVPTGSATPTPGGLQIRVGRAFVDGSATALVDVFLATGGAAVGGMQNDLLFDNTIVSLQAASRCRINPAIGDRLDNCLGEPEQISQPCKTLNRNLVQCGSFPQPSGCPDNARGNVSRFRGIVAATAVPNTIPIPSTVVYTCEFTVLDRARLPLAILNTSVIAADPRGNRLGDLTGVDGLITVSARVAATAFSGSTSLQLYVEDAGGFPAAGTAQILATSIAFTRSATVLALAEALPETVPADSVIWLTFAAAAPTATPTATSAVPSPTPSATVAVPPSETPTTAPATVTATQLAPSETPTPELPSPTPTATTVNSTPTPTAEPSATATRTTAATATATADATPTSTPFASATPTSTAAATHTAAAVATATAAATPTATASATETATATETPTPAVRVLASSAVPIAGVVDLDIVLDARVDNVGGVQNDLLFDSNIVNLASAVECRINPAIGDRLANCEEEVVSAPCKTLSRLLVTCGGSPQPSGCPAEAGPNIRRFRAVIGATAVPNKNAIPNGILYTCTFNVVAAAQLPTSVVVSRPVASDPLGERIDPAGSLDGIIFAP